MNTTAPLTYTLEQIAAMAGDGFTAESIRRELAADRYPHVRHGRRYAMTMTQIQDMIAAKTRQAVASAPTSQRDIEAAELEAARAHHRAGMRRRGAA